MCEDLCDYVAKMDEPETWGGENMYDWGLHKKKENGGLNIQKWRCPHPSVGGQDRCIFHTEPDELPKEVNETEALLEALNEAGESPFSDGVEHRAQFIGATFGAIDLSGEMIFAREHDVRFDHVKFHGRSEDISFEDTQFVTQQSELISFHRASFTTKKEFEIVFTGASFITEGKGDIRFTRTTFETEGKGQVSFKRASFITKNEGDVVFNDTSFIADGTGGVVFARASFITKGRGHVDFANASFTTEGQGWLRFIGASFTTEGQGDVRFNETTFTTEGQLRFRRTTFSTKSQGDVLFTEASFITKGKEHVWFLDASFITQNTGHVFFSGASFITEGQGDIFFVGTSFITEGEGHIDFREASFITQGQGDVQFEEVPFTTKHQGHVVFENASFTTQGRGCVVFSQASFTTEGDGYVVFDGAAFTTQDEGNIEFDTASFITNGSGDVRFIWASFITEGEGHVIFIDAMFETKDLGNILLNEATFANNGNGSIKFKQAKFGGFGLLSSPSYETASAQRYNERTFHRTGTGEILFDKVTFDSENVQDFRKARFTDDTDFTEVTFDCPVRFDDWLVGPNVTLSFSKTEFIEPIYFGSSNGSTEFKGELDFSDVLFSNQVDFEGEVPATTHSNSIESESSNKFDVTFSGSLSFRNSTLPDGTDFSNMKFPEDADFAGANLTGVNFSRSDLSGANLERAQLNRAELLGTNLIGANLYGVLLGDARINHQTAFWPTADISITNVLPGTEKPAPGRWLSQWKAWLRQGSIPFCRYDPRYDTIDDDLPGDQQGGVEESNEQFRLEKAAEVYGTIEQGARDNSLPRLASEAFVGRKDVQRKQYYRKDSHGRQWLMYIRSFVPNLIARYGESPWRVLGYGTLTVTLCGLLYWAFDLIETQDGGDPATIFDSLYFSSLTFTTLGYGDFKPTNGYGQLLAVSETAIGVIMLAILVFVFGRRATR